MILMLFYVSKVILFVPASHMCGHMMSGQPMINVSEFDRFLIIVHLAFVRAV